MNEPNGGMAFPGFEFTSGHGPNRRRPDGDFETYQTGMSLRDYFAAAALSTHPVNLLATAEARASWAYSLADAMLAERAK